MVILVSALYIMAQEQRGNGFNSSPAGIVNRSDDANARSYTSPDKARIVKVVADTKDAFLYDTAKPPAFKPVYLASGVADVRFSDTGNGNGKGLEIMLKLGDSSYDMFDANGNAYNSGTAGKN
jgi:hypothetical protein